MVKNGSFFFCLLFYDLAAFQIVALVSGVADGKALFRKHTVLFHGGEQVGFIHCGKKDGKAVFLLGKLLQRFFVVDIIHGNALLLLPSIQHLLNGADKTAVEGCARVLVQHKLTRKIKFA